MIYRIYQEQNNITHESLPQSEFWLMLHMKDIFEVWECESIFNLIDPERDLLMHENDGLIFTINACPYYPGTCNEIIKWKPPHMNTIDFKLQFLGKYAHDTKDMLWGLYVRDGKNSYMFSFFIFDKNDAKERKMEADFYHKLQDLKVDSKNEPITVVLECNYDPNKINKTLILLQKHGGRELSMPAHVLNSLEEDKRHSSLTDEDIEKLKGSWCIMR